MSVQERFGKDVLITGWAHTPFGRLEAETLESLVVGVARDAIAAAGIEAADVDEIYLGTFNAGMVPLAFPASLALGADPALADVPATRVENACASGSAAVHQGIRSLLAGTARTVLVIGAETMTQAGADVVGAALLGADYDWAGRESSTGFAGLFAEVADAYRTRYGDPSDDMGLIAAKNHRNAMANPLAQLHKDLGAEFCQTVSDRNPVVAGLLRRTDCAPISDGAAAMILTTAEKRSSAAALPAVRVLGFGQANDLLPAAHRDPLALRATRAAVGRAMGMAGVSLDGIDLAEVHDCFTIAELLLYEAIGLTEAGDGGRALREGWVHPGGRLPVNLSGGLKAKGHPVGATGVSQHVLAAMQLTGTAGGFQHPGAGRVLVQNMGGLAIANYAGVLEAT